MNIITYGTKFKDILQSDNYDNDPIYLIIQFFCHKNKTRYNEIKECLQKNIKLGLFNKIILLNERIYTNEELGLTLQDMNSIQQVNIINRMKYSDVFRYVVNTNLHGYIVLSNSDIFFDKTILNVRKSCLTQIKSIYSLLRFEYKKNKKLEDLEVFRTNKHPIPGSQDVWIYHTKYNPSLLLTNHCNFCLGKPGCDNTIAYLFYIHGYNCINEPFNVRTYHNHASYVRNIDYKKDTIHISHYLFPLPIIK